MSKMNIKDKDQRTLNDKLKQWFRINKGNYKSNEEHILTQEIEREISSENPINQRARILKDLTDDVLNNHWEDRAAEKFWNLVKDLLNKDVPKEHRHTVLTFLSCLVQGQYSRLSSLMRVKFFKVVQDHEIPEDIGPRLELLQRLTDNGKDIVHLEEKVGGFLLKWMPTVTYGDEKRGAEFLSLLVNVIKYNSAYIDEDIVSGLVQFICHLCYYSNNKEVVSGCLDTLDTIVGYNINLQSDSLQTFITALCRSVNVDIYCEISWKIMKKLLGTDMGHTALYTMCRLLQDPNFQRDVRLLRGAVFYVNMGLWGTHRIQKLKCTPISVLPSFIQALKCNHPIVMYEVTLAVQRLVNKYGPTLLEPTWSVVLDIIQHVIAHIETSNQPATQQVSESLHDTLNGIENLMDANQYNGDVQRFYDLIERCSDARPEASVFKLIDYRASIIGLTHYHWQSKLANLVERYFKIETRTSIRTKVLDIVTRIIHMNRYHEDELIERIIVPYLQHVDVDPDIMIRNVSAHLLVDLCLNCEIKRCLELLDILEKIINKPFTVDTPVVSDNDIKDVKTAVSGVIDIFTTKIYRLPSSHAIRAYKILVNHLEQHYKEPQIFNDFSTIRYLIFECFLKIRANSLFHVGYTNPETGTVTRFSPYLILEHASAPDRLGPSGGGGNSPPVSPAPLQHISCQISHISLAMACKAAIMCLKQERDWRVLQLVLKETPNLLQNRALILARQSNDIDYVAAALCSMITDRNLKLPESLTNAPSKFTISDFRMFVFPVLTSLASYHTHLEPNLQQRLIKCLEIGLTTRCASQCVTSLTTCTLEMRDAMNKLLPAVLSDLSKISAVQHIAIPILEFLSMLARLPTVYSSFIDNQYRLIFALLLPYTNPFKYNHYTVSLAHHVIAVWFLKCRLSLRREFVKCITSGLNDNVVMPLEEGQVKTSNFSTLQEDSSHRKRSSSLTEQGSRGRRERPVLGNQIIGDLKPQMDEKLMTFHMELAETCIDLLARYTFSTYTARPKRCAGAEFLLKDGQSMTWFLNNRLITVTTSGCSMKSMRAGLCDSCWIACKAAPTSPEHRAGAGLPRRASSIDGNKDENRLSRQSSGHAGSSTNTAANSPTEESKRTLDDDFAKADNKSDKEAEASKLEQILGSDKQDEYTPCACWCQGWAEILVRRPTGDMSWIMRVQNSVQCDAMNDFPLQDLTALLMPNSEPTTKTSSSQDTTTTESFEDETDEKSESKSSGGQSTDQHQSNLNKSTGPIAIPGSPGRPSTSRQSSRDSIESLEDGDDDSKRSRNPVRRSNSSPEMSASWKNPFLNKDKLVIPPADAPNSEFDVKHAKTAYSKDMRVSYEAIPEEISGMGTTPPVTEAGDHPGVFQTQYSHPGTTTTTTTTVGNNGTSSSSSSSSNIVPASPIASTPSYLPAQNRVTQHHMSSSKPPQSPTQQYSRTSTIESSLRQIASSIESKPPLGRSHPTERREERPDPSALPPIAFRDRGHTISVMSPVRDSIRRGTSPRVKEIPRPGINPSSVFLQLYHTAHFGSTNEKPLLIPPTTALQRAVTNLDRIQPYETHKIGVLYVGPNQASNESEILANQYGSMRYAEFLQRLGTLVCLKNVDESVFLGGLDRNGEHGNFAYIWQDDVTQVAFHVATLMPTKQSDPKCTWKKQHIGNDYVTIVYNESGESYDIQTVKGQFNYACVIIQPLDYGANQVTIQAREELAEHIGHSESKIISDQNLGILSRQLALHANLASMVSSSLKAKGHNPYSSNWLERLRHIKRLRRRLLESSNSSSDDKTDETRSNERVHMEDFTEYTIPKT
ncbi:tuberin [Microplitis demolitor]|uniref:tuberin n=1 Tax=Microplitis demolitor TaxID=69319 RepID=UPI0004CDBA9F|nr:tuberin [Microplitis demolitor]XP_053596489.1 tuberin [Microplitis demolitor]